MRHKKFTLLNPKKLVRSNLTGLILSALLSLSLGLTGLYAQETIPVTGGNASGSGGSASYSVGQIVYTTNAGNAGFLIQGVQHAYEIYVITGIAETGITINISAYPNPTTDNLTLKIDASTAPDFRLLSYQLYTMQGKLLQNHKLTGNETGIDMSMLGPAAYILKVNDGEQAIKIFRLIKN